MSLILKRCLIGACLTVVALSLPTPAIAAESGGATGRVSLAQSGGICDLFPGFWWCRR